MNKYIETASRSLSKLNFYDKCKQVKIVDT